MAHNPVKILSETRAWYRVDRRQTVIQHHQLSAWVSAVLSLPSQDHRDYLMLVLLTGLRRGEALGLEWADVDLVAKTFTVRDPKNHRDHTLPIPGFLMDLLTRRYEAMQQRKPEHQSRRVFADAQGRQISNFRYVQSTVTRASGVTFCVHDLRRTFATVAESLDVPAYALKRLLNHKDGGDVTGGYLIVTPERLRRPMQQIEDFVLKAAGVKASAEVVDITRAAQR